MSASLVVGALATPYGPLNVAAVVGDHASIKALRGASRGRGAVLPTDAVVVASGWADIEELLVRCDPAVRALPRTHGSLPESIRHAVAEWVDGRADELLDVAVVQPGGDFRQVAWTELRAVPAGSVVTYGELAARAGNPKAARAAGGACATNLVAPFVPCHRVVPSGGRVGDYAYGSDLKRAMLIAEGAAPSS